MGEFVYSNVDREIEVYGYDSVTKSHCRKCRGGLEPDNLGSYDYKWLYIKGWYTTLRLLHKGRSPTDRGGTLI